MSPRRTLEDSIAHLREELADGEPLSAEDRALLDRTLEEVSRRIDDEEDEGSLGESVSELTDSVYDELLELAGRIEKSRPRLSLLLGRIVDSLSQLGI